MNKTEIQEKNHKILFESFIWICGLSPCLPELLIYFSHFCPVNFVRNSIYSQTLKTRLVIISLREASQTSARSAQKCEQLPRIHKNNAKMSNRFLVIACNQEYIGIPKNNRAKFLRYRMFLSLKIAYNLSFDIIIFIINAYLNSVTFGFEYVIIQQLADTASIRTPRKFQLQWHIFRFSRENRTRKHLTHKSNSLRECNVALR
jgi:hypothetical protein